MGRWGETVMESGFAGLVWFNGRVSQVSAPSADLPLAMSRSDHALRIGDNAVVLEGDKGGSWMLCSVVHGSGEHPSIIKRQWIVS